MGLRTKEGKGTKPKGREYQDMAPFIESAKVMRRRGRRKHCPTASAQPRATCWQGQASLFDVGGGIVGQVREEHHPHSVQLCHAVGDCHFLHKHVIHSMLHCCWKARQIRSIIYRDIYLESCLTSLGEQHCPTGS